MLDQNILKAVAVGFIGYYGVKLYTQKKTSEGENPEQSFLDGGAFKQLSGFNPDGVSEASTPQPQITYNINVESASLPNKSEGLKAPTKKEASSSSGSSSSGNTYYSTNFQTQSTTKAVGLSKTSATDKDRFASSPSGATIDRNMQQSIAPSVATERANESKKVWSPSPLPQSIWRF